MGGGGDPVGGDGDGLPVDGDCVVGGAVGGNVEPARETITRHYKFIYTGDYTAPN